MRNGLKDRGGEYRVASNHYWRNVIPDSVCLFQKNKQIVGEGKLKGGLLKYTGNKISPATGARYEGRLQFDVTSIVVYPRAVPFDEAERIIGKTLTWRGVQKLTMDDRARIKEASEGYRVLIP